MKIWILAFVFFLTSCSFSTLQKAAPYEPSLIIISVDGLRHDYLELHQAPMIAELAAAGVHVQQLQPVFPSKTFPNHYSLVTGLYPEQHGIVDNSMYDPVHQRQFAMSMSEQVADGFWWQGEPIWITAELQGVKAATYFFPGSEAEIKGKRPTHWFPYKHDTPNRERTEQVLAWLALPDEQRPRVITLYYSDVDSAGHAYGPYSPQVKQALFDIDNEIAYLVNTLRSRQQQVNLIISSDHGMAEVDQRKYMIADELFDSSLAQSVRFSREIVSIFPKEGQEEVIYQQIAERYNPEQMRLYRKHEIPARFHHQNHVRIAPIIMLAEQPWIFVRRSLLPGMKADPSFLRSRGSHGYDNNEPEMQGMLVAHGPAFQQGKKVPQLTMVDFYNVMAAAVGLTPAPNQGDPAALSLLLVQD